MTGPELRALRLRHGLSQHALASLMGYDQRTISHFESGYRPMQPRFTLLLKKMLPYIKKEVDSDTPLEYNLDN